MTVDSALVTRKLLLIARDLDALQPILVRGIESYQASRIDQAVTERYLERMVGRMIDVNYHLLTESGEPPPSDYFASFVLLGPLGVLDATFARHIASCAGLRNRIVHEYDELDPQRVFAALESALRDIPVYLAGVESYLAQIERGPGG
ncbi:MAG: hypothetical protein AMXMBFR57_36210 [Acidimicrobiia bacterium]